MTYILHRSKFSPIGKRCWLTLKYTLRQNQVVYSVRQKLSMAKMSFFIITLLLVASNIVLADTPSAPVAGNPLDGKTKSEACVACHGLDGNSITPIWPKIAGLSYEYLMQQLLNFQQGEKGPRYDPTMYGIVANLSGQDLADLSAYYTTQTMSIGAADPSKVELGQAIYRGGNVASGVPACSACHGPTGSGNYLANFPRLGGQNSEYVVAQLNKFRDKTRSNDTNSIMRDIAGKMTDKEIEAVASYVAGLH